MPTTPIELRLLADHFQSIGIPCELELPPEGQDDGVSKLSLTLEQAFDGQDVEVTVLVMQSLEETDPEEDTPALSVLRLVAAMPYDWSSASLPVMVGVLEILNPLLPFGCFTLHPAEFGMTISHTHAAGEGAFDTNPLVRILDTWSFYFPIAARPLRQAATGTMDVKEILEDFSVFMEEIDREGAE